MLRSTAFLVLSAVILVGTCYSWLYSTYLDTSNPLLTHLPHPLHDKHYFANKRNSLNVLFIKQAWGWTSLVFLASWSTSPPSARTKQGLYKWLTATASWLVFTSWFFGPALFERLVMASGGECVLALPTGEAIAVPEQYCLTKSTLSFTTHPDLFTSNSASIVQNAEWNGATPRLRRGHDVSGHIFLLTMSVLFLADQLRPSLRSREAWSIAHRAALAANVSLIGLWLLASYTTSVYFHSPGEKISGYLLGIASFALTQLPFLKFDFPARNPAVEKLRTS